MTCGLSRHRRNQPVANSVPNTQPNSLTTFCSVVWPLGSSSGVGRLSPSTTPNPCPPPSPIPHRTTSPRNCQPDGEAYRTAPIRPSNRTSTPTIAQDVLHRPQPSGCSCATGCARSRLVLTSYHALRARRRRHHRRAADWGTIRYTSFAARVTHRATTPGSPPTTQRRSMAQRATVTARVSWRGETDMITVLE